MFLADTPAEARAVVERVVAEGWAAVKAYSMLDELDLYIRIGLTPREALYSATVAPPRFLELPDQDDTIARSGWVERERFRAEILDRRSEPRLARPWPAWQRGRRRRERAGS